MADALYKLSGGSREIEKFADIKKFREQCGCSSVMIARAAQGNCSIFRPYGMKKLNDVIIDYLKYAVDYDHAPTTTKYCIQNMLKELQESPRGKKFLETQTLEQICAVWNMGDYCKQKQLEYYSKGILGRREVKPDMFNPNPKRFKADSDDIIKMHCAFIRASYTQDSDLPKSKLIVLSNKKRLKLPVYNTIHDNKLFRSICNFNGQKYSSTYWEKNKRFAEQGAALVCVCSLGLIETDTLVANGSMLQ